MVGMLVDEYYADGINVTMFDRPFRINPAVRAFCPHLDCPFHGFHTMRQPDGRLRLEVTDAIEPRRDVAGRVDVAGTMQVIASEIERWVRANPEQWLAAPPLPLND